ncbi:hypothetical protein CCP3SC1AL1_110009 [Gammaproteobacteria bacterium]
MARRERGSRNRLHYGGHDLSALLGQWRDSRLRVRLGAYRKRKDSLLYPGPQAERGQGRVHGRKLYHRRQGRAGIAPGECPGGYRRPS